MKTHKSIRSNFMDIFDVAIVNTIFLSVQTCYKFINYTLLIFLLYRFIKTTQNEHINLPQHALDGNV